MDRTLRKKHALTWITIAFILPAMVVVSWLSVPESPLTSKHKKVAASLPEVMAFAEVFPYTVRLRTDHEQSEFQLEWLCASPLSVPSAVIYLLPAGNENFDPKTAVLIGRIESAEQYLFTLDKEINSFSDPVRLVLYDFIHEQIIQTFNLEK